MSDGVGNPYTENLWERVSLDEAIRAHGCTGSASGRTHIFTASKNTLRHALLVVLCAVRERDRERKP